ncbi:phosphoribosylaminoimidazolecarboxamide formyltransferase / IMP cyclohydrolase [Peptoniphilus asaccharolyticus DSM 20463]|uniref:Bifunctional purine biosynthesis protein PurH n=1 Tax=Peptoniphilus asaccharolyticus DSM 20463 TaxID=573058 RepID=A0A1W1V2W5_PEPAS|nr:bifunctional phosphoribosylaminoimidazolecarboxamide formyltransferase/IMP cyclohydrolase [Peptoniphilus asaccharolyticus]MBL7576178.1 bifunctional phosphoribosylaminoimidazolecarboxamide formyltransferase/IMP cyclohydrolase [Peptoniphilus asaccharolyticus]SMB87727.1 phosphoribosylaminoimidazolecarboxamide formyltransferase / IMP cyclohydrolase [Peptoniphilus asaccharolyticus DSM 20463]
MRALISVFDKTGIKEFAQELEKRNWEIISTGGTYKLLEESGIKVISVEEVTGQREILDGRVKTLHPKVHGAILNIRDNEAHQATIKEEGITSIDMVVNTLYPFEDTVVKTDDFDEIIEMIDIGGPSMIRAAAKNFRDVLIVTDPSDYNDVLENLDSLTEDYRKKMAIKAFETTAKYDRAISDYLSGENFNLNLKLNEILRYGENPHQKAAYYTGEEVADMKVLHGKQLSYNNLNDLYAAVKAVKGFEEPTAVAVKHTNPCGIGTGENLREAYLKAYECDTESIFGGIIALNREVDLEVAQELSKIFLEIIIAPKFSSEAFELLSSKKNLRLVEISNLIEFEVGKQFKQTLNGLIVQDFDEVEFEKFEVVSNRKPTEKELKDLEFAFKAVKYVASNGVVLAKDGATYAIGQGQTKRAWAVEEVLQRARELDGVVLASDGFFFADTVELLKEHGIKAAVSPGGSVKDEEVIEAANRADITLIFTGTRHFRH